MDDVTPPNKNDQKYDKAVGAVALVAMPLVISAVLIGGGKMAYDKMSEWIKNGEKQKLHKFHNSILTSHQGAFIIHTDLLTEVREKLGMDTTQPFDPEKIDRQALAGIAPELMKAGLHTIVVIGKEGKPVAEVNIEQELKKAADSKTNSVAIFPTVTAGSSGKPAIGNHTANITGSSTNKPAVGPKTGAEQERPAAPTGLGIIK